VSEAVRRLRLRHPRGETPVWVGAGALQSGLPLLAEWTAGRSLFVVTTPRVRRLHGERLAPLLAAASRAEVLAVAEGEEAKTLATAGELWDRMLAAGGKRDSRLVSFGGGSVGDLGGFVAGCFLRGIEYAQLPTTLLAQVDAAIGGKTAVDRPSSKNSVGLFHHPAAVVCDSDWLATLPREEMRCGLAEVVKMAALLDPPLLARVERELDALLAGRPAPLAAVAAAAAAAKIAVVEADPEEGDRRRLLNFGHTLGHALEAAAGFGVLRHGDAVAYGMLFALRLARRRGWAAELAPRLVALLRRFELPPLPDQLAAGELLELTRRDKKARESGLAWVLPVRLGEGRIVDDVAVDELERQIAEFLAAPFALG
jgi:3-dehydroquinate synthase